MSARSMTPDLRTLEIPIDAWTQPFWDASAQHRLLVPRCASCSTYRWPPGPFCAHCQSQSVVWVEPGIARIYSFTLVPAPTTKEDEPAQQRAAALIEFPDAGGIRIFGAIVDTPLTDIRIGAQLAVSWSPASNATVPVFTVVPSSSQ